MSRQLMPNGVFDRFAHLNPPTVGFANMRNVTPECCSEIQKAI